MKFTGAMSYLHESAVWLKKTKLTDSPGLGQGEMPSLVPGSQPIYPQYGRVIPHKRKMMLGRQSQVFATVPTVDCARQKPPGATGSISYLIPSFFFFSFCFFLFLFALARISNTMLNKSGQSGHHCSVPDLRGKVVNLLSIYITKYDVR